MTEDERDALLIRLDERSLATDRNLSNHLKHHWAIELVLAGALVTALVARLFT